MEMYTNLATSTLSSGINNSVTSLDLASAANFPTSGNFRLNIEDELLLCTAVSGTTLTIVRGIEGTTGASHASAVVVSHVVTSASLQRIILEYGLQHKEIDLTPFAWENQSTATMTTDDYGTVITNLTASASLWNINAQAKSRSTGDYKVTIGFSGFMGFTNFGMIALGIYNTSNGNTEFMRLTNDSNEVRVCVTQAVTFPTLGSISNPYQSGNIGFFLHPNKIWFQIEEISGSNYYRISNNGIDWIQVHTGSVSGSVGTSDGIFFGIIPYNQPVSMRVFHWDES